MKKKIYEIDATKVMNEKLEEFKKELFDRSPDDMRELLEEGLVTSLIELCFKAGFQDGSIEIGEMIHSILKGEAEGPSINLN
jgi:hypothetical protein